MGSETNAKDSSVLTLRLEIGGDGRGECLALVSRELAPLAPAMTLSGVVRGSRAGGYPNQEAEDMEKPRADRPRLLVCDERAEAASDFLVLALDSLFASRRPLASCV